MGEAIDERVVERARAGDEAAWHGLVARHVGLVHAICRLYGLKGSASAEVNQVVWLRLVEHLPRIRTPEAISAWIAATTRAECLRPRWVTRRVSWAATRIVGDGEEFFSAFMRIGVRCQRLLRLVALQPRPSDEEISAALDVEVDDVEPTCARCLDRLSKVLDTDGRALLGELEQIVAHSDHVPDGWERAADAALGWLRVDATVVERVYDSTTPRGTGPTAAGLASDIRQVRFGTGATRVELALDSNDNEVLLTGYVLPRQRSEVMAVWPDGAEVSKTDDDGLFRFDGLPVAPLWVHVDGGTPVKTGWVVP